MRNSTLASMKDTIRWQPKPFCPLFQSPLQLGSLWTWIWIWFCHIGWGRLWLSPTKRSILRRNIKCLLKNTWGATMSSNTNAILTKKNPAIWKFLLAALQCNFLVLRNWHPISNSFFPMKSVFQLRRVQLLQLWRRLLQGVRGYGEGAGGEGGGGGGGATAAAAAAGRAAGSSGSSLKSTFVCTIVE